MHTIKFLLSFFTVLLSFTMYQIRTYDLIKQMNKISEEKFAEICQDIIEDREIICKHNPIGNAEETLLWMLLGCLVSYLSLSELETPCFTGKPTAETYRQAVLFVLKDRKTEDFKAEKYLEEFRI